jgi:undecaprenyl-diphosphatase
LLISTQLVKPGHKKIPFADAFIIGIAQAVAVVPGISRSGATISTGLLLGNDRDEVARFSFLMVLLPIIGAALLDILSISSSAGSAAIPALSLVTGFVTAYISGYLACSWMIRLVRKGNLSWFALYCALVGIISIIFA